MIRQGESATNAECVRSEPGQTIAAFAKRVGQLFASGVVVSALTFASGIVLARGLSVSDRGVVGTLQTLVQFTAFMATFGLGRWILANKHRDDYAAHVVLSRVRAVARLHAIVCGSAVALVVAAMWYRGTRPPAEAVIALVPIVVLALYSDLLQNYALASNRAGRLAVARSFSTAVYSALLIAAFATNVLSVLSAALALTGSFLVLGFFLSLGAPGRAEISHRALGREYFALGVPVLGLRFQFADSLRLASTVGPILFIAFYFGPEPYARYLVTATFPNVLGLLVAPITSLLLAEVARSRPDTRVDFASRILVFCGFAFPLVGAGLFVLTYYGAALVFGARYQPDVILLFACILYSVASGMCQTSGAVLLGSNRPAIYGKILAMSGSVLLLGALALHVMHALSIPRLLFVMTGCQVLELCMVIAAMSGHRAVGKPI